MSAILFWREKSGFQYALTLDLLVEEKHTWPVKVTEHPVESGADVADHVIPELEEIELELFFSNEPINPRPLLVTNLTGDTVTEAAWFTVLPTVVTKTVAFMRQPSSPAVVTLETKQPDTQIPLNPAGAAVAGLTAAVKQATGGSHATAKAQAGFPVQSFEKSLTFQVFEYESGSGPDLVKAILETLKRLKDESIVCDLFTPKLSYQKVVIQNVRITRGAAEGTGASVSLTLKQVRTVFATLDTVPLPAIKKAEKKLVAGTKTPTPPPTNAEQEGIVEAGTEDDVSGVSRPVTTSGN